MGFANALDSGSEAVLNSGFWSGRGRSLAPYEPLLASERAVAYLLSQRFDQRASLDGRRVGIQSSLALSPSGEGSIELYELLDGVVAGASSVDPLRQRWQKIALKIEEKLGFPLEPELFSNMLLVACTADLQHPYLQRLSQRLLATFRRTDARGLYHFFTSLRFACDIDCTGVAARARIAAGDIDIATAEGRAELRRITDRILRSAAVCDVAAEDNGSHGKDNGPLCRHVFKVYLDDHEVQGAEYDRGLKNNPVVVANALFPVLFELAHNARSEDEMVSLREFSDGDPLPRTGQASVAELVVGNLRYLRRHLSSGAYRDGCRYYGSPDAFLCFYSELIAQFGPMAAILGSPESLVQAIVERRAASDEGIADPSSSLNTALRAIAASNVGIDASPELAALVERQADDGSFPDFGPLYSLGTSSTASVYFGSQALTLAFALRALMPASSRVTRSPGRDPAWTRRLRHMALASGAQR